MVEGNRKRVCATRGAVAGPGATPCLPGAAARRSAATASEGPGDLGHETDHLVLYLMVRLQPDIEVQNDFVDPAASTFAVGQEGTDERGEGRSRSEFISLSVVDKATDTR